MAYYDETVQRDEGMVTEPDNGLRRRSSISSFSADGRGNFSKTQSMGGLTRREEWGADYDRDMAQAQTYSGYQQLGDRARAVRKHNENLGFNAINSVMKEALSNGGRIPQYMLGALNRDLGYDGKTRAVYGGGFTQNGNFVLQTAQRGPNGSVMQSDETIDPLARYNMMLKCPGVWNQQDVDEQARFLSDRMGYRKGEFADPSTFATTLANFKKGASQRQAQSANAEMQKFITSVAQSVLKGRSRDPERDIRTKLLLDDKYRDSISRSDRPVFEDDGKTQKLDDAGQPMFERATDEERMARLDADVRLALGDQNGGGGADADAQKLAMVNAWIDKMYGPRKLSPQEQEIQTRQLDNAVEDQRRADVMRRPQQLVHYTDADGNWKVGNGWIRDGKVYDPQGYEIEGATPTDAKGNAMMPASSLVAMGRGDVAQGGQEMQEAQDSTQSAAAQAAATQGGNARAKLEELAKLEALRAERQRARMESDIDADYEAPVPDRQEASDAIAARREAIRANEIERRRANGRELMAQGLSQPERPLSETRLADIPGAVGRKLVDAGARGLDLAGDIVDRARDKVASGVGSVLSGAGEHLREMGNVTPGQIAANAKRELAGYGDAIASGVRRVRKNLADMDARAAQGNSPEDEERNRFYANRDGRNAEQSAPQSEKRRARLRRNRTDPGPTFRADLQRQKARDDADRERWERLDARLAELEVERAEAARQKKQGQEWAAQEKKRQEALRLATKERDRLRKLYESGDVDAIRRHEQEVNELEALVNELMGED